MLWLLKRGAGDEVTLPPEAASFMRGTGRGSALIFPMISAIHMHVRRGETNRLTVPIVVLALALFVAVEGFGTYGA